VSEPLTVVRAHFKGLIPLRRYAVLEYTKKEYDMTTLTAYPVEIKDGVMRLADDSSLPKDAKAVLIILPEPSKFETMPLDEWQKSFDRFFAVAAAHPPEANIDDLSDEELNKIVHVARNPK
jgi:hypothetical protein